MSVARDFRVTCKMRERGACTADVTYTFRAKDPSFCLVTPMSIDLLSPRIVTSAAARPITCTLVTDAAQAESLRPEWERLLERAERNELTQSPDWLLGWWQTYGDLQGRQLRLGVFHEGDRLVGLAPLARRRHWYRGLLPFRRLEFLASGEPDGHAICSNHLSILAERGGEEKVANRLAEAITAGAFGSWDEVVLPMLSADTAWPELLTNAFRAKGMHAESAVTAGAPFVTLPQTWDKYLAGLEYQHRKNLRRTLRLFDDWSGGTTELECLRAPADVERGKKILIDLHHQRWAKDDDSGVFRSALFNRFHDKLMTTLAERGALEILVLRARGEPVAAIYSFVWAGKVCTYQTGRRADLPANLSPGITVFAQAIRRAIENGHREFDMLADAVFYKLQLTAQVRPLVQVRVVRPSIVEGMRKLGICIARRVKRAKKPTQPAD